MNRKQGWFRVSIKARGVDQIYVVPAPDKLDACVWGERQAAALGLETSLVQVLGDAAKEEKPA